MTLAVDKGNSVTKFDDLRIVERQTDIMNPDKQTVIKQDFEDTQAVGLYPFVKGSAGGVEDPRIHLSERNEPYTQYGWNGNLVSDVLEGNWSLKAHKQGAGLMLQTIPQNIKFEPNKKYTVQFDYQTDGENVFTAGTINGELKNNNDFKPVGELTSTAADGQTKHYEAEIIGMLQETLRLVFLQQVPIKISLWITLRSQWNQKINLVYLSNLVYKLNVLVAQVASL